jgi:prepilin-type N-terminal cleavage/methylation domain-containing protein
MRIARDIRRGFTLIEMLVSMALILFIMTILSQAFATALETFRGLKSIGDLQQSLRIAQTALTADLSADHFETGRKLSDANIVSDRPREGYFFIRQASAANVALGANAAYQYEGADADGLPSTRSYDQVIAFTIRLKGNAREKFMMTKDIPWYVQPPGNPPHRRYSPLSISSVNLANKSYTFFGQERDSMFNFNPGAPTTTAYIPDPTLMVDINNPFDTYSSQWAEVAYFLLVTGTTDDPTNPGATGNPLFGLYRAQHLLVPKTDTANEPDATKQTNNVDMETLNTTLNNLFLNSPYFYAGVSCNPGAPLATGQLIFNAPLNVADTSSTNPAWTINGVTVRTQGMANRVLSTLSDPTIALPLAAVNFPYGTAPASPPRSSTLVVPNVVSFNIQVLYAGGNGFTDLNTLGPNPPPPPAPPGPLYIYDTTLAGYNPRIQPIAGLKITVRVFDPNTRMTRQLSVIQDM